MNHQTQWQLLQEASFRNRMPQALLFVGPMHCGLNAFTSQLCQLLLCQNEKAAAKPCQECMDCRMISDTQHPDLEWIRPEKTGAVIKIDQIRQLQHSAYLTPQRGRYSLIVIERADSMNVAAANALLKILEEPAAHLVFVLIAEQLSTILPTVLSRCRLMHFSSGDELNSHNLLGLAALYQQEEEDSEAGERALLLNQAELILDDVIALMKGQAHPCAIATKWTAFEFNALLWFLYLVFAQLQRMKFVPGPITGPATDQLLQLSSVLNVLSIFKHLDAINTLLKQLHQRLNLNKNLALDNFLCSLITQVPLQPQARKGLS